MTTRDELIAEGQLGKPSDLMSKFLGRPPVSLHGAVQRLVIQARVGQAAVDA
jgi:hypothetical protein